MGRHCLTLSAYKEISRASLPTLSSAAFSFIKTELIRICSESDLRFLMGKTKELLGFRDKLGKEERRELLMSNLSVFP